MAITKNGEEHIISEAPGQTIDIYNGDWAALKEITTKWNFRDEESALRYALAILTLAKPGSISVNGKILDPADSLIKDKNGTEEKDR